MTKKNRNLIITLSALALLIIAFILLRNSGSGEVVAEPAPAPAESILLSDFEPEMLRGISIENPEGTLSISSMDGQNWIISNQSEGYPIKGTLLRSLVSNLSSIRGMVLDDGGENPSGFGLNPPAATARMVDSSGKVSVVLFGNSNPAGNGRYAALPDKPEVYLVGATQANKAFWSIEDLREDHLPEIAIEAIASIAVKSGENTFRTVPHTGELDPYRPLAASMDVVEPWQNRQLLEDHIFQEIMTTSPPPSRISGFPESQPSDPGTLGLGSDSDRIRIQAADGGLYDLQIGIDNGEGKRYARESSYGDMVFLIDENDLGLLNLDPYKLTNQFVYLAGIDRVKEIRIEGNGPNRVLSIEKLGDMGDDSDDIFRIDGIELGEKDFKTAYQAVIGLLYEGVAQYRVDEELPEYTFTFTHVDPEIPPAKVSFRPYNSTYFLAGVDGEANEFIIGRYQIDLMLAALNRAIEAGP